MPSFSPYDWNESIQQRNEYIEDRLKDGSPVSAVAYAGGLLMVSGRKTQRKIYEIYDRLMFSAIGNHSDIEQVRVASVDVAHAEGFQRSPDDVSVQRLVGMRISPAIKKVYSDPFAQPIVFKGVFAELGKTPDRDQLVTISYDGEFATAPHVAVVAGTAFAEDRMREQLSTDSVGPTASLDAALTAAVRAWGVGVKHLELDDRPDSDEAQTPEDITDVYEFVSEHLSRGWVIEAGILERETSRESRFRLLSDDEIPAALKRRQALATV